MRPGPVPSYLAVHGRPIQYGYVKGIWPITMYQNVYSTEPGSAEMPSAGRPFTPEILTRLVARGIGVVPSFCSTQESPRSRHPNLRIRSRSGCRVQPRTGSTTPTETAGG